MVELIVNEGPDFLRNKALELLSSSGENPVILTASLGSRGNTVFLRWYITPQEFIAKHPDWDTRLSSISVSPRDGQNLFNELGTKIGQSGSQSAIFSGWSGSQPVLFPEVMPELEGLTAGQVIGKMREGGLDQSLVNAFTMRIPEFATMPRLEQPKVLPAEMPVGLLLAFAGLFFLLRRKK